MDVWTSAADICLKYCAAILAQSFHDFGQRKRPRSSASTKIHDWAETDSIQHYYAWPKEDAYRSFNLATSRGIKAKTKTFSMAVHDPHTLIAHVILVKEDKSINDDPADRRYPVGIVIQGHEGHYTLTAPANLSMPAT
jgi:hypothetical protein